MNRHVVKPISFRIYPENKFLYISVNIWPTKKVMQSHCGGSRRCLARTTPKEIIQNGRKLGLFAEVNFFKRELGAGVTAHEMGHAAFCWAGRRRISISNVIASNVQAYQDIWNHPPRGHLTAPADNPEERVVWVLGEMVKKLVTKCYDLKIYEE